MADRTCCPIASHEELGPDDFFLSLLPTFDCGFDRMTFREVLGYIVVQKLGIAFYKHTVAHQVSDEDPFQLPLGDHMQATISGVRLVSATMEQKFSVFVNSRTLNDRPFLVDFRCYTP